MNHSIVVIAEDYPSENNPSFPFVQELTYSLSNEGYDCSVIAPQSITRTIVRHENVKKFKSTDCNPEGISITVYRPFIVTFSNTNNALLSWLSNHLYEFAIRRTLKKLKSLETVYCYFWHMGLFTAKALKKTKNCKLIVQASECNITINDSYRKKEIVKRVDGVVCASRKNYDESLHFGLLNEHTKTAIIPNGYRPDEFYKIEQSRAREKLGLDKSAFIIAYVGDFNDRKGSLRLAKAIDKFDDVYSIFIGKGDKIPTCKNILFMGTVPHNQLCLYLNCANIFVLPTKAEGCCNAIIEAIACGLPVVSSNKSFNNEILDANCSIRIDEEKIDEIVTAIEVLKNNDKLREKMSLKAIELAHNFIIEFRSKAIHKFIEEIENK